MSILAAGTTVQVTWLGVSWTVSVAVNGHQLYASLNLFKLLNVGSGQCKQGGSYSTGQRTGGAGGQKHYYMVSLSDTVINSRHNIIKLSEISPSTLTKGEAEN